MADHHVRALGLARQGDWDAAHRAIQSHGDELSCLIHGYLHRVEGDLGNAGYWYRKAGAELPDNPLDDELERLEARAGSASPDP